MNKTSSHLPLVNAKRMDLNMESIIIPMLKIQPKLLLTGSTSLYVLDIVKRKPNDVDLGLKEPLTQDELDLLINFWGLTIASNESGVDEYGRSFSVPKNSTELLKSDIMSFFVKDPRWLETSNNQAYLFKIDIFNKVLVDDKDIIDIIYTFQDTNSVVSNIVIPICHPSIPISYKAKYAFDPRVSSNPKHSDDLKDLLLNIQFYFKLIKKKFK